MPDVQQQALPPIFLGEDVDLEFAPPAAPAASIAGWSLRFSLSPTRGGTPVLTLTTGGGITVTDGAAGEYTVSLSSDDTAGLTPPDPPNALRTYYWDVWRVDAGSRRRLAGGKVGVGDPEAAYP